MSCRVQSTESDLSDAFAVLATVWSIWNSIPFFIFHWHLINESRNGLGYKRPGKSCMCHRQEHTAYAGGRSCSRWAQTCSVTGAPVPASPAVTHRHAGSRGCSPAPLAGTNHHTGHGFLGKQREEKRKNTTKGWKEDEESNWNTTTLENFLTRRSCYLTR